ncbi:MAG: mechanosensitive ion channel domain-containing protein [Planctomycetota bacterium]
MPHTSSWGPLPGSGSLLPLALLDLHPLAVTLGTAVLVTLVLFALNSILKSQSGDAFAAFGKHLTMIVLTLVGVVIVVLTLDDGETRKELLSLLGLLFSAVLAFSSTTFVANMMAGMQMKAVKPFGIGDFVEVGDHFGRITELGLFHIELQTEESNLCTLPNLFVVQNPATTIRSSGTILSATVSLGYDVSHNRIEELLRKSATECGLKDPFVHVEDLGDFSVTYRLAGRLDQVKHLLSARSKLRRAMLDALHQGDVEIVSPTFMNQRQITGDAPFIPEQISRVSVHRPAAAESIVFDKADSAESIEELKSEKAALEALVEEEKKAVKEAVDKESKDHAKSVLASTKARLDNLSELLERRLKEQREEDA